MKDECEIDGDVSECLVVLLLLCKTFYIILNDLYFNWQMSHRLCFKWSHLFGRNSHPPSFRTFTSQWKPWASTRWEVEDSSSIVLQVSSLRIMCLLTVIILSLLLLLQIILISIRYQSFRIYDKFALYLSDICKIRFL